MFVEHERIGVQLSVEREVCDLKRGDGSISVCAANIKYERHRSILRNDNRVVSDERQRCWVFIVTFDLEIDDTCFY